MIPLAPLMKPPSGLESAEWLSQCIHEAHALPIDRSAKADLLSGLSILSGLVYGSGTITDLISREGVMDILRESSFAQYLTQQAERKAKRKALSKGSGKVSATCWRFGSVSARRTLQPPSLRLSMTCNASRGCSERRSKWQAWRNSGIWWRLRSRRAVRGGNCYCVTAA